MQVPNGRKLSAAKLNSGFDQVNALAELGVLQAA